MATQQPNSKATYPAISSNNWWLLRERFKNRWPTGGVNASYLSTTLGNMTPKSAATNLLPPLRHLGLIDHEGKPTDLANLWRGDETYQRACESMRESVYPTELLDAVPADNPDFESTKNWFMNAIKVGEAAAQNMARTYLLLCEADVSKRPESTSGVQRKRGKTNDTPRATPRVSTAATPHPEDQLSKVDQKRQEVAGHNQFGFGGPSLHIDVQIHISPDSTEKQIDTIFASMAKHLYGNSKTNDS